MPRTSYDPKNRFVHGSKLSEYELTRLLWLWFAGNTFSGIERNLAAPSENFSHGFQAINKTLSEKGFAEIEPGPLGSITRQTAKKYALDISEHLFWDVFRYDDETENVVRTGVKKIQESMNEDGFSPLFRLARGYFPKMRVKENSVVKQLGQHIADRLQGDEKNDLRLVYKEFLLFRYWIMVSDRQNYRYQRLNKIIQDEKAIGQAIYKYGRWQYRRSNALNYDDMHPLAFLLGVLGFGFQQTAEHLRRAPDYRDKSEAEILVALNRKFASQQKQFQLYAAMGGPDIVLRLLAVNPLILR